MSNWAKIVIREVLFPVAISVGIHILQKEYDKARAEPYEEPPPEEEWTEKFLG